MGFTIFVFVNKHKLPPRAKFFFRRARALLVWFLLLRKHFETSETNGARFGVPHVNSWTSLMAFLSILYLFYFLENFMTFSSKCIFTEKSFKISNIKIEKVKIVICSKFSKKVTNCIPNRLGSSISFEKRSDSRQNYRSFSGLWETQKQYQGGVVTETVLRSRTLALKRK